MKIEPPFRPGAGLPKRDIDWTIREVSKVGGRFVIGVGIERVKNPLHDLARQFEEQHRGVQDHDEHLIRAASALEGK